MIRKGWKVLGKVQVPNYCYCDSRLRPGVAPRVLQGKRQIEGREQRGSAGFCRTSGTILRQPQPHWTQFQTQEGIIYLLNLKCWHGTRTNLLYKYLLFGMGIIFLKKYKLDFYYLDNTHWRKIITYAGNVCCRKISKANVWKKRN